MLPNFFEKKLVTLSPLAKTQVLKGCVERLHEISGQNFPRHWARIKNKKDINNELKKLNENPLNPGAQVAHFTTTGEQQYDTIMNVYDFASRLGAIVGSKAYSQLGDANLKSINKAEHRRISYLLNQFIASVTELTAGIHLKVAHKDNKNFSLSKHSYTFSKEAASFIENVIRASNNSKIVQETPTILQQRIRNLEQGINKKRVAALVAEFNGIAHKQIVNNSQPTTYKPESTRTVIELPKIKLTIR